MREHAFTPTIRTILESAFGESAAAEILDRSELVQYLNEKTRSASRGSKARGSFANIYAIYVLVEDYIKNGFVESGTYADYEGAQFSLLFQRQRELPFGSKLQNHALNSRMNEEFRKFFPMSDYVPILRNLSTQRYSFNEGLLKVRTADETEINLARVVIAVIDAYVQAKKDAFDAFLEQCQRLAELDTENAPTERREFIVSLLSPEVDARIFEIVSFAILKAYYGAQSVWIGPARDAVEEQHLVLYKTGRTNANDGGIDFVMRPLGRFYQVTETLDLKKYFLDIDKIQRFPITFVVKSEVDPGELRARIEEHARGAFTANHVVAAYMAAIEGIINIGELRAALDAVERDGRAQKVVDETVTQARAEWYIGDGVVEGVPVAE